MLPLAGLLALALAQSPHARFDPAQEFPCGDGPLAGLVRTGLASRASADLEFGAPDPPASDLAAVRYLEAMVYLGCAEAPPADVAATYDRAVHILVDLTAEGHGPYSRKALATLANLEMQRGAFTIARDTYRQYADLYPESPWAWVALIRAGLCEEELRRDAPAALLYLDAADRYGDLPLAYVLGHAYAAAAFESRRDTQRALAHYRRALEGWDSRYGPVYDIHAPASKRRAASSRRVPASRAVDREGLQAGIAALERAGRLRPAARR